MTVDRFLPDTQPMAQPQEPQGKNRTPSPPQAGRAKKKQRVVDQPPRIPSDAPARTPPRVSGGITIREPVNDCRPTAQVGTDVASSSQPELGWQPTFKLGDRPLPASASIRTWAQGEGGGWRKA